MWRLAFGRRMVNLAAGPAPGERAGVVPPTGAADGPKFVLSYPVGICGTLAAARPLAPPVAPDRSPATPPGRRRAVHARTADPGSRGMYPGRPGPQPEPPGHPRAEPREFRGRQERPGLPAARQDLLRGRAVGAPRLRAERHPGERGQ